MASYLRSSPSEKLIWVAEVRGKILWCRTGKVGNTGRFTSRELVTPDEARRALEEETAARVAEGYVLLDPNASVDAPLRLPRAGSPKPSPAQTGKLPAEIAREVETRYTDARAAGSLDLREAISIMLGSIVQPCVRTLRLGQINVSVGERGSTLTLWAIWMERESTSHDTESEGFEVRAKLLPPVGIELDERFEESIGVDYFEDDLAGGGTRGIRSAFEHRLSQSVMAKEYGSARLIDVEVVDAVDFSPLE